MLNKTYKVIRMNNYRNISKNIEKNILECNNIRDIKREMKLINNFIEMLPDEYDCFKRMLTNKLYTLAYSRAMIFASCNSMDYRGYKDGFVYFNGGRK